MPIQPIKNDKSISALKTSYVKSYTPSTALGDYIGMYQLLPELRGFWSYASADELGGVYDYSGHGRTLYPYSNFAPAYGTAGLLTYADFTRANLDSLYRTHDPGLSISSGLTIGTWVLFDIESTNVECGIMGRWGFAGNISYLLHKTPDNKIKLSISSDGVAITSVEAAGVYLESKWLFVVGRLTPGAEIALCVNGQWYKNASVVASLYTGININTFGFYALANYLDGKLSNSFLCNYAIPDTIINSLYSRTRALYVTGSATGGGNIEEVGSSSSSTSVSSSSSSTSISSSSTSRSFSSSSSSTTISSSSTSTSVSSSSTSISTSSSSSSKSVSSSSTSHSSSSTSISASASSSSSSSSYTSSSTTSSSSSSTSSSSTSRSSSSSSYSISSTTSSSSSSVPP
jgi:hypothetical protein